MMLFYSLNPEFAYKDFWTSYMSFALLQALKIYLSKTKIMVFGRNKRKLNQEAFYLDKDQIEIIHEYKYLGIDFYSHEDLSQLVKTKNRRYESLDGHFKERSNSRNHMLGTQIASIQGFGASYFYIWHWNLGKWLEKSLEGFQEGHEDAYDVSCQSAFFDYLSYFVGRNWRISHIIVCS